MKIDLHIVSFDIPLPADYGGVIDVFYKVKALSEKGLNIHLHCFYSDRSGKPELELYTKELSYYERNQNIFSALSTQPYIIQSRSSKKLLNNLLKNDAPILFEGIHTCAFLQYPSLEKRIKLVRTHNVEHEYYEGLRLAEKSILKRQYYFTEARRLAVKEEILHAADKLLAISHADVKYFYEKSYAVSYLPVFHPFKSKEVASNSKSFLLYHGNLSVAENEKAAKFLLREVMSNLNLHLVIAGKDPSESLIDKISRYNHVELIKNPSHATLEFLINTASINVLPTFQASGIKLKLLAALYYGGHCLVNPKMVKGTGLEKLCELADSSEEWINKIKELSQKKFTKHLKDQRIEILDKEFNNLKNADIIIDLLSHGRPSF